MARRNLPPSPPMTDAQMMQSPMEWPRYPVLPIKKRNKDHAWDFAFLFANGKPTIYTGRTLYHLDELPGNTWGDKLRQLDNKDYPTFDAIVADGWIVD